MIEFITYWTFVKSTFKNHGNRVYNKNYMLRLKLVNQPKTFKKLLAKLFVFYYILFYRHSSTI